MKLASSQQAASIARFLNDILVQHYNDAPFEFEEPRPVAKNWNSGTDHLQGLNWEAAWASLGVRNQRIPFMATRVDNVGGRTTWTEEGKAWLEDRKDPPGLGEPAHEDPYENGEPFNLLWHQVIGVIRMLEIGFAGNFINVYENTAR